MFKIEENKIHLTRGDCCTISLNVEDYSFKVGDIVTFCLYNKRALNKQPVLKKSITLEQDTDNVDIELTSLDTKIGEILQVAPEKAEILIECGMHCIGCPASQMETLEEACEVHGIDVEEVVEKLNAE